MAHHLHGVIVLFYLFSDIQADHAMKNRMKLERARMNITKAELAQKVNVSRQTIHSIETGKYIRSIVLPLKIARVFKKSVEEIFILDDKD